MKIGQGQRAVPLPVLAAWLLGITACSDQDERSDLRPDGPPEVLAVLASDDPTGNGVDEIATFCKPGDLKRPELVPANPNGPYQVCPTDVAAGVEEADNVVPVGWYVRIQFDELLDPDKVEDLVPILDSSGNPTGDDSGSLAFTRPVSLSCNGAPIGYHGYYNPSGNALTWPVGPSLYVAPDDPAAIPTGSECAISIVPTVIVDKDGEHVPAAQLGPYAFKLAPLALVATSPPAVDLASPGPVTPTTIDAKTPLVLTFNAPVDPGSLMPAELSILEVASCDAATGTAHPAVIAANTSGRQAVDVHAGDAAAGDAWARGTTYRVAPVPGADLTDVAGGVGALAGDAGFTVCFHTGA